MRKVKVLKNYSLLSSLHFPFNSRNDWKSLIILHVIERRKIVDNTFKLLPYHAYINYHIILENKASRPFD